MRVWSSTCHSSPSMSSPRCIPPTPPGRRPAHRRQAWPEPPTGQGSRPRPASPSPSTPARTRSPRDCPTRPLGLVRRALAELRCDSRIAQDRVQIGRSPDHVQTGRAGYGPYTQCDVHLASMKGVSRGAGRSVRDDGIPLDLVPESHASNRGEVLAGSRADPLPDDLVVCHGPMMADARSEITVPGNGILVSLCLTVFQNVDG